MSGITPRFLTPLRVEQVAPGWWRLLTEFKYDSAVAGARIMIDAGYLTDFASLPRPLTVAYALLAGHANAPALLHDWAYSYKLWSRERADGLFLEAMETDGRHVGIEPVAAWRRYAFYAGVRLGGWTHW